MTLGTFLEGAGIALGILGIGLTIYFGAAWRNRQSQTVSGGSSAT